REAAHVDARRLGKPRPGLAKLALEGLAGKTTERSMLQSVRPDLEALSGQLRKLAGGGELETRHVRRLGGPVVPAAEMAGDADDRRPLTPLRKERRRDADGACTPVVEGDGDREPGQVARGERRRELRHRHGRDAEIVEAVELDAKELRVDEERRRALL